MEGWDDSIREISKVSHAGILSSQNATILLKSMGGLPVLVVSGAEDKLVSLKSSQVMASKLANSVSNSFFTVLSFILIFSGLSMFSPNLSV